MPIESVANSASAATNVALPTDLPARIYPQEDAVSSSDDLSGYTAISILFDDSLGWKFVASNLDSAAQIFAYFPNVLEVALNIPGKLILDI